MPFIVAIEVSDRQLMFYMQQPDGTVLLTANRANATHFPEERADMLAAAHNVYTLVEEAMVEGVEEVTNRVPASIVPERESDRLLQRQ